jgi:hypothetical protein
MLDINNKKKTLITVLFADVAEIKMSHCVRFEVLTAVSMSMLVLWAVTPCGFVGRYQCFTETY